MNENIKKESVKMKQIAKILHRWVKLKDKIRSHYVGRKIKLEYKT